MTKPESKSCGICAFWAGADRSCHRFPPSAAGRPITDPLAWCGEFTRRVDDVPAAPPSRGQK